MRLSDLRDIRDTGLSYVSVKVNVTTGFFKWKKTRKVRVLRSGHGPDWFFDHTYTRSQRLPKLSRRNKRWLELEYQLLRREWFESQYDDWEKGKAPIP